MKEEIKEINLAKKIRQARLDAGLSQTQLGSAIGLSDKSISAYEKGRATPPLDKLRAIARATRHPLRYFTNGEVEEKAYSIEAKLASIEEQLMEIRKLLAR